MKNYQRNLDLLVQFRKEINIILYRKYDLTTEDGIYDWANGRIYLADKFAEKYGLGCREKYKTYYSTLKPTHSFKIEIGMYYKRKGGVGIRWIEL